MIIEQQVTELLTRGVENIYPSAEFLEKELQSGKQLTIYTGYDPTAPTLHIGHGITMVKLRQFQDLGHKIIMLIGDFTGMIGDPTDKSAARQKLTREQVLENAKGYADQAKAILNFEGENPVEIKYNSEWLAKLSFADVIELASHFTVQRMLERDMFEKRMALTVTCPDCKQQVDVRVPGLLNDKSLRAASEELKFELCCSNCKRTTVFNKKDINPTKPIHLHEFFYPLMQGYDSVAMDVSGEVGGNDQTFNMLAGRDLMKSLKNKEKFVLTTKLLVDATTGKKMSKSEGNMVALSDSPEDMFGKVMRWPDEMIGIGFELCTHVPMEEVKQIEKEIVEGQNPRDAKLRLAYEVTKTFLGGDAATKGQEHFRTVIQNQDRPEEIPELQPTAYDIVTVLVEAGFVSSNGDARRNIDGGGVKVNDEKVSVYDLMLKAGDVVQKGKRFFVRIV